MGLSLELLALQDRLQHRFDQPRLLERAITHRSFSSDHYERLEFLGDSVLSLAVSALLFESLTDLPEGDLSRVRANLVKQETLFDIATRIGLPQVLKLGDGEKRSGGHKRPSILADALEAIIGAVYLDSGLELNAQMSALGKDPKTALQEWLQGRKMKLPLYRVVGTQGEAHRQTFDVECLITETGHCERGIGASRRAAEQAAAAAMLEHLQET